MRKKWTIIISILFLAAIGSAVRIHYVKKYNELNDYIYHNNGQYRAIDLSSKVAVPTDGQSIEKQLYDKGYKPSSISYDAIDEYFIRGGIKTNPNLALFEKTAGSPCSFQFFVGFNKMQNGVVDRIYGFSVEGECEEK